MSTKDNEVVSVEDTAMSEAQRDPSAGDRLAGYQLLCASYHAIDDFRAKLLGFLPLATGTGIFLLLGNLTAETKAFLGPIGVFGFVVTFGLFSYEIYGIRKCAALIDAGKHLEHSLRLHVDGQFNRRPHNVAGLVNEPFAAGVIYPAVLAAWTYLSLVFERPRAALWTAILVFTVFFAGTLIYDLLLRKLYADD